MLAEEVELREWDMPPICKVIQLLLEYGLEPNAVVDNTNIMHELKYVSTLNKECLKNWEIL